MHRDKGAQGAPRELRSGQYDLLQEDRNGDVTAQPVYLYAPNKKRLAQELGGWFIQWQEATMLLAKAKELTLTDWRVLAVLQAKLDFDNWIRLTQREVGAEIDVAQPNVSTSLRKLLDMGVILSGPATRGVRTYRLNPSYGFKGTLRNAVREKRAAPPSLRVVEGGRGRPQQPELLPPEPAPAGD